MEDATARKVNVYTFGVVDITEYSGKVAISPSVSSVMRDGNISTSYPTYPRTVPYIYLVYPNGVRYMR